MVWLLWKIEAICTSRKLYDVLQVLENLRPAKFKPVYLVLLKDPFTTAHSYSVSTPQLLFCICQIQFNLKLDLSYNIKSAMKDLEVLECI